MILGFGGGIMKYLIFIFTIFGFMFISSCSSSQMVDRYGVKCNPVPSWVKELPDSGSRIYAVGYAMPDTFPERSLEAAKLNARLELARTIQTKIKVDTRLVDMYIKKNGIENNEKNRTTVIRNLVEEKAVKMVKNSKIEAVFYDNCNLNQRGEGAYYVLAYLSR